MRLLLQVDRDTQFSIIISRISILPKSAATLCAIRGDSRPFRQKNR